MVVLFLISHNSGVINHLNRWKVFNQNFHREKISGKIKLTSICICLTFCDGVG